MKNLLKWLGIIVFVAVIGFSFATCDGDNDNGKENDNNDNEKGNNNGTGNNNNSNNEPVLFTMTFSETSEWNKPGNENSLRWSYQYHDANKSFDLSSMKYIFTYSFSSDIDIDFFTAVFVDSHDNDGTWYWENITDWDITLGSSIKKDTKYSNKAVFSPNSKATDSKPENIYLEFEIKNRNVSTPATLSFYQFSFEPFSLEPDGEIVKGAFNAYTDNSYTTLSSSVNY